MARSTPDNALRYRPELDGHVESYFLRAHHPERPLAVWLKATVFAPRAGSAVAEQWCVVFDGERQRSWANKLTVPFGLARFEGDAPEIEIGDTLLKIGSPGAAQGELDGHGGRCALDLHWERLEGPLAEPLNLFPSDRMIEASLPRNKTLTPFPALVFGGELRVWDERWDLQGWTGMQGHNWGTAHAFEYAWGQALFEGSEGPSKPACMVEAFTGRLQLGGRGSPPISCMVVRQGEREYRFDSVLEIWRQKAHMDGRVWTLDLRGSGGRAQLRMVFEPERAVCLGYHNPDGRLAYCLNSKLASCGLQVQPPSGEPFSHETQHGAALEFLVNRPDEGFERVV